MVSVPVLAWSFDKAEWGGVFASYTPCVLPGYGGVVFIGFPDQLFFFETFSIDGVSLGLNFVGSVTQVGCEVRVFGVKIYLELRG